jgi:hypothetical protein
MECSDMVTLDATEREGTEPAIDDGQVAGEALPIHDEVKAADAHVRAGSEDEVKAADAHVRAGSEDVGDYPHIHGLPSVGTAVKRWSRGVTGQTGRATPERILIKSLNFLFFKPNFRF